LRERGATAKTRLESARVIGSCGAKEKRGQRSSAERPGQKLAWSLRGGAANWERYREWGVGHASRIVRWEPNGKTEDEKNLDSRIRGGSTTYGAQDESGTDPGEGVNRRCP